MRTIANHTPIMLQSSEQEHRLESCTHYWCIPCVFYKSWIPIIEKLQKEQHHESSVLLLFMHSMLSFKRIHSLTKHGFQFCKRQCNKINLKLVGFFGVHVISINANHNISSLVLTFFWLYSGSTASLLSLFLSSGTSTSCGLSTSWTSSLASSENLQVWPLLGWLYFLSSSTGCGCGLMFACMSATFALSIPRSLIASSTIPNGFAVLLPLVDLMFNTLGCINMHRLRKSWSGLNMVARQRIAIGMSLFVSITEIGEFNLILEGLREFMVILKASNKLEGKRPQSDLEYALWKAVESRAGGKLDMKNSGKEKWMAKVWFICKTLIR